MLAKKDFMDLSLSHQKGALLDIFSQLNIESAEMDKIRQLLGTDFVFDPTTLESIYDTLKQSVETGKNMQELKIDAQLKAIHTDMERETKMDQEEADKMLIKL